MIDVNVKLMQKLCTLKCRIDVNAGINAKWNSVKWNIKVCIDYHLNHMELARFLFRFHSINNNRVIPGI